MKKNNKGTILGYFRPTGDGYDFRSGVSALAEAGVGNGNIFFEQEGQAELERLFGRVEPGDRVVVLHLADICRNIDDLFRRVRWLLLQGVGLRSLGEPWFRLTGEAMQDSALYELIGNLHELSRLLPSPVSDVVPAVRRPVGRPRGFRVDYRRKLDAALVLYKERKELSVAEICGSVGLNERTFYRFLDCQGNEVIRRPKGRKSKRSMGKR